MYIGNLEDGFFVELIGRFFYFDISLNGCNRRFILYNGHFKSDCPFNLSVHHS